MYRLDSDQILRIPDLEAFCWLEHGFGTRHSGTWPPEDARATLKQIHSTRVAIADKPGIFGEGDALITDTPGVFIAIKTADCLPVLLVDPENKVVAAVHAGWRGTAGNIVRTTIDTMVSDFHSNPKRIWAAIGPGIRACCYEVSGDVAAQFASWLPKLVACEVTMLDLTEINQQQLTQAGVPHQQVLATKGGCTRCEANFHSFRRDKESAGRMLSAIRIRTLQVHS